jgi:hypothetical protein
MDDIDDTFGKESVINFETIFRFSAIFRHSPWFWHTQTIKNGKTC